MIDQMRQIINQSWSDCSSRTRHIQNIKKGNATHEWIEVCRWKWLKCNLIKLAVMTLCTAWLQRTQCYNLKIIQTIRIHFFNSCMTNLVKMDQNFMANLTCLIKNIGLSRVVITKKILNSSIIFIRKWNQILFCSLKPKIEN